KTQATQSRRQQTMEATRPYRRDAENAEKCRYGKRGGESGCSRSGFVFIHVPLWFPFDITCSMFPDYLSIAPSDLGRGQPVKVRVKGDLMSIAQDLAEVMLSEIREGERSGRGATLIV